MKLPLWLRWTIFGVIVFTSLILPLILFESPLSKYGEIALNWAGDNAVSYTHLTLPTSVPV